MTLEEAIKRLNSGSRNISKLCADIGAARTTVDDIIKGHTKNPSYETALKIIKWVEDN